MIELHTMDAAPKDGTRFLAWLGEREGWWMVAWCIPYGNETLADWSIVPNDDWQISENPIEPRGWIPLSLLPTPHS